MISWRYAGSRSRQIKYNMAMDVRYQQEQYVLHSTKICKEGATKYQLKQSSRASGVLKFSKKSCDVTFEKDWLQLL